MQLYPYDCMGARTVTAHGPGIPTFESKDFSMHSTPDDSAGSGRDLKEYETGSYGPSWMTIVPTISSEAREVSPSRSKSEIRRSNIY